MWHGTVPLHSVWCQPDGTVICNLLKQSDFTVYLWFGSHWHPGVSILFHTDPQCEQLGLSYLVVVLGVVRNLIQHSDFSGVRKKKDASGHFRIETWNWPGIMPIAFCCLPQLRVKKRDGSTCSCKHGSLDTIKVSFAISHTDISIIHIYL